MLSYSVISDRDLNPAKTHGAWFQGLMKPRFVISHCKRSSVRDAEINKR